MAAVPVAASFFVNKLYGSGRGNWSFFSGNARAVGSSLEGGGDNGGVVGSKKLKFGGVGGGPGPRPSSSSSSPLLYGSSVFLTYQIYALK